MKKNIPLFKVFMDDSAINESSAVLRSGFIGQGEVVNRFENELCDFFQNPFILSLNSATSAQHLALHLLKKEFTYTKSDEYGTRNGFWGGFKDGDEILTSPLTCTATNWPILANNLKIKWVDIDPETLNLDLNDLERKISDTTKAIVVVHWGGYPVDLERLRQIQEKSLKLFGFKPAVIEDCAHAMGSKYKGKLIGNHGNICTFSLQAIKHITAVDGGLLFLPYKEIFERAKLTRWYGIDRESPRQDFRCESDIEEWGFKFHMNDVNAAIGSANFKNVESIVAKHKSNADFFDKKLSNVNGVCLLSRNNDMESSFWLYSMLVQDRSNFMKHMKKCGIAVSQVHQRNDIHTCVKKYKTMLPNLDKIIGNIISIPVGWWLTEEDREYIVDCIVSGW